MSAQVNLESTDGRVNNSKRLNKLTDNNNTEQYILLQLGTVCVKCPSLLDAERLKGSICDSGAYFIA